MKYRLLVVLLVLSVATFAQSSKKSSRLLSGQKSAPSIRQADSLFTARDWNGAIPIYESVLKGTPANSLGWNRLGFSYHNVSNYEKALACYLKSLEYKPAQPLESVVQSRLARVYALKNESDKAFQSLDRALQLGYSNISELESNNDFNNIRNDARFENVIKRANFNAYPCLENEQSRKFDFWVGEWDAYVRGTNNLAGHSRIEIASGGCMILENWTSVGAAFNGKSINFVDPVSGKWKQVWVGSGKAPNASEFLNGEYRDGAMRFEFDTKTPQGGDQKIHFYFFNEGPDQVRQFHESSNDDGKTWTTNYDFTYMRVK